MTRSGGQPVPEPGLRQYGAATISVEVVIIRVAGRAGLAYRCAAAALPSGDHPDHLARRLAGLPRTDPDGRSLVHSTSWRYDPHRSLLLTYAALPDPTPDQPAAPLPDLTICASGDPLAPSPGRVDAAHVAAHAVRHLALLARTDPTVSAVLRRYPVLADLLAATTPVPAGQLAAAPA